jgi:cell shape-determining protein MreD
VTLLRSVLALVLALAGVLLWPGALADLGLVPDFLLLAALGAGLFGKPEAAVAAGIAAGLLGGAASLEPFGLEAALLGAAALLANRLRFYFQADHPAVQGVLAGSTALLIGGIRLALLVAAAGPAALGALPAVLAGAAATAVAAPVVLFVVEALRLFRGPRAPEGRPQLV